MTDSSRGSEALIVERRWTISNLLSLSRIFLLIPIVLLILQPVNEHRPVAIALMVIAALTDFLDGFLARRLNQVTDFGRLLDPAADKVCVIAISAALVLAGDVPLWFAVLVALRDVLIVIGGSFILTRKKIVVQSVWAGKWTVTFIAAYLILAALRMDSLSDVKTFFLYLSTLSVFISFGVYAGVYRKYMLQN